MRVTTAFNRMLAIEGASVASVTFEDVGKGAEARRLYECSLEIRERLTGREPDNTSYQHDLSVSLNKLGDLALAVDVHQARELYERSLRILEGLAAREPRNTGYQRDLSASGQPAGRPDRGRR
jgi:hypothetical protein